MIDVDDKIPEFRLAASKARTVSNADFTGRAWLLYFYPKADTPGCTTQACALESDLPHLMSSGVEVLGVSPDPVKALDQFADKYNLTFPLASDPDHKLAEQCGVWVEKKNYGKTYFGIQRSSFLIDKAGVIRFVWRNVKASEHAQWVRDAVAKM